MKCCLSRSWDGCHALPILPGTGLFSGLLNNVSNETDADFTQCADITHTGALLIGTYDTFTDGDPTGFLKNINDHMPTAAQNRLVFIEGTGHTYQMKHQEVADRILVLVLDWQKQKGTDGSTSSPVI